MYWTCAIAIAATVAALLAALWSRARWKGVAEAGIERADRIQVELDLLRMAGHQADERMSQKAAYLDVLLDQLRALVATYESADE